MPLHASRASVLQPGLSLTYPLQPETSSPDLSSPDLSQPDLSLTDPGA